MPGYSLTHLADGKLAQDLRAGASDDRAALAMRLAQIAEFDHRRLYLPAYPSMYQFCLGELKYSEDAACKRICVARAARRFPFIFDAIDDGGHNLSTLVMLAPVLLPETAQELVAASSGMSKSEVAHFLAHRFPKPDVPTLVEAVPVPVLTPTAPALEQPLSNLSAPGRITSVESAPPMPTSVPPAPRPRVTPLAPERYAIQVTVSKATHDKLRQAQALLSHAVPSGDVAEVLDRALDVLISQLEKRKFGATDRPRHARASRDPRHISAHVRRAVRARDGDQCTYVDNHGKRCKERKFLEFDHDETVARGGEATISNIRLRCRAHNQYEAERTFGAEFMRHKRTQGSDARGMRLSAARSTQVPAT
jgi:hypothetical protein